MFNLQAQTQETPLGGFEKALQSYQEQDPNAAFIHLKNILSENPNHIPGKILMGKVLLQKGYPLDAEVELKEALELGGDIESILSPLGEALIYQKRWNDVLYLGQNHRLSSETRVQWHMLKARVYANLKETKQELTEHKLAIKLAPNNSDTINGLIGFYVKTTQLKKAQLLLELSLELDSKNYLTWQLQGETYKQQGKIAEAINSFKHALTINPSNLDSKRGLASIYIQLSETENALTIIEQILQKSPNDPRAKLLKANLLLSANESELAKQILNSLNQQIGLLPDNVLEDNPWVLFINGISSYLLENYESAINDMLKYLIITPDNFQAVAVAANSYIKIGNRNHARDILDKHSDKVSQNINLAILLCDLYIESHKQFKCERLLPELYRLYPDDLNLVLVEARLHQSRNNVPQAITLLEKTNQQQRNNKIESYLIYLYTEVNQPLKAGQLINQLLVENPNNIELMNAMASALIELEKLEAAFNILQKLLKNNPEHFLARYNQALVLLETRRPKLAKEILLRLIRNKPKNTDARLLLAKTEIAQGNANDAIHVLKELLLFDARNIAANEMLMGLLKVTGKYEEALNILDKLLRNDRLSPEYIIVKAKIFIAMNEKVQAHKQLNILFSLWHKDPQNLLILSRLQQSANDIKGARLSINLALELAPELLAAKFADAKLNIYEKEVKSAANKIASLKGDAIVNSKVAMLKGDLQLVNKQPNKAQTSYLNAFSLNIKNGMALVKSYNLAIKGYQKELFEQLLLKALDKYQANFYYRNLLADYLLVNQRYREARVHYLMLKDVNNVPNKAELLNNLAFVSMHYDLDAAQEFAKQASELKPTSATILDTYGWVLANQKLLEQALTILRKAQSIDARDSVILYHLGYTLHQLGRTKEAIVELKKSTRTTANFAEKDEASKLLASIL